MNLEQIAYHTKLLKQRTDHLEKLIDVAKLETDEEIKELDADEIKTQFKLVEMQHKRLKFYLED